MISRFSWRTGIILAGLLLISSLLAAQSAGNDKRDQAMIEHTKNLLASSFDARLPKVPLEYLLKYEAGGAAIAWEVNDCGEQSGNPQADEGRDFPICVETDFDANHFNVTLMIAVGTVKTGVSGPATLFYGVASDVNGKSYPISKLGDLPAVVHRPMPRQARDPMVPTRASSRSPETAGPKVHDLTRRATVTSNWHWFERCNVTKTLGLVIQLDGKVVYRSRFPVCRSTGPTPTSGERMIVFHFRGGHVFQEEYRTSPKQMIEGNIWQAGADPDDLLLGVTFSSERVLLNTIHVAKPDSTSVSQLDRGIVLRTFPLTRK